MLVRPETAADHRRIAELVEAAFAEAPHTSRTEHRIVAALREAGALSLSLVAERAAPEPRIVGHVAFSPVEISDRSPGWFGLGPVAVDPAVQGQGIGSALIRAGLEELARRGAHGCVLVGEPAYYQRFGFANDPALIYADVPAMYFLVRPFGAARAAGTVTFHPGFGVGL
ncbi:MAG: GNAT family N-acetyltransferase [Kofleriaceae bacterium]